MRLFPPLLQRHFRLTPLTLRWTPIHRQPPHPTTTTTTTPTTALGHPAILPPGNCHHPFTPGNAQCTPSTSRSGTRIGPARSFYVEEINQQGIVRQFDPEHFFHKLTGDHIHTNQMSDYWRSHYGLPLKHGGTPFQPTWASSSSTTTPSTIPTAAKHLATLLFGAHAADQLTSSGATSSANLPDLTAPGSTTTHSMAPDRLAHLAILLRELSSTS